MKAPAAVVVLGLCAVPQFAHANMAHNNFAPGHGYQSQSGWSVQRNGNSSTDHAMQFIADAGGMLDTIDIAVTHISGSNRLNVSLMSSSNGAVGSVLASWSLSNVMAEYGTNNAPVTITNSDNSLTLVQGTTYWLMASTPNGTTAAWNLNSVSNTATMAQRQNAGAWTYFSNTDGAFDVQTLPAPAGVAALGLGALVFRRRRSR
jgi:hypothetical protein